MLGLFAFVNGNLPFGDHAIDGIVPAHQGSVWIRNRRIGSGAAREGCQCGGLFECKILYVLSEIEFGRCRESVHAVTQIDLIGIEPEDLLFRIAPLDLN